MAFQRLSLLIQIAKTLTNFQLTLPWKQAKLESCVQNILV